MQDAEVDLMISDHFAGSNKIFDRLKGGASFFSQTMYVNDLDFCKRRGQFSDRQGGYLYNLDIKNLVEQFVKLEKKYDELWIANWEEFANAAFNYIRRYLNHKVQCVFYEDGPTSYCWDWKWVVPELQHSKFTRLHEKIRLNIMFTHDYLSAYYVLDPSVMVIDPGCKVKKIPSLPIQERQFVEGVNNVFGYDGKENIFDKKVIFFEEWFHEDGYEVGDEKVVDLIADIVGKDNLMIKRHPRATDNRWSRNGYITNGSSGIPWEVIALNQDMSDKILVGMMCSSMVSTYRLFGIGGRMLSYACLTGFEFKAKDKKDVVQVNQEFFYKMFTDFYPNQIHFPKDENAFKTILRQLNGS
jgi:hypothetical protein